MLRSLLASAAIVALAAPAAIADTQTLTLGNFSKIRAEAAMNVVWQEGPSLSARLETTGSDFSDANIKVEDGMLVVTRNSVKKRRWYGLGSSSVDVSDDGKTVKVNGKSVPVYTLYVTSPELADVTVGQSSRLEASGLDSSEFTVSASSGSAVVIAGRADAATLSASSSGSLDASAFEAVALQVTASSSGEAEVSVTGTGAVNIGASSSGDVKLASAGAATFTVDASSGGEVGLSGMCAQMTASASSGADVDAGGLSCKSVRLTASSGADIDAFASDSATANASSGGDIIVHGNPAVQDTSSSSGGDVTFAR